MKGYKEAIIQKMGKGCCSIDPTTFQNDMTTFQTKDDILMLLVHLTYDAVARRVFILDQEIMQEFMRAVKVGVWDGVMESLNRSEELLQNTWQLNEMAVAEGISFIHNETVSILKYNDENSLACTVLMAYYSAKAYYVNPIVELSTEKDLQMSFTCPNGTWKKRRC